MNGQLWHVAPRRQTTLRPRQSRCHQVASHCPTETSLNENQTGDGAWLSGDDGCVDVGVGQLCHKTFDPRWTVVASEELCAAWESENPGFGLFDCCLILVAIMRTVEAKEDLG